MELLLLETSGPYGIEDAARFGKDHVKGSFGALTFLRKVLKTWHFATEETMRKLKVLFVHAHGESIHLWTLEIPSKNVQVLEHVISAEIPINKTEGSKILDFGNFGWKLKEMIEDSSRVLNAMEEEHESYLVQRGLNLSSVTRNNLATLVSREIEKPVKGSKYGLLFPQHIDECNIHKNLTEA